MCRAIPSKFIVAYILFFKLFCHVNKVLTKEFGYIVGGASDNLQNSVVHFLVVN